MKDNFSVQAALYAQYRPTYPKTFYDFILNNVELKETAWDCATGNGQVAVELSKHFTKVYATDISENQISNASHVENIIYMIEPAEKTTFPDNFFDLITVAQAIHWFNFDLFYNEVKRVIKDEGLFVAATYDICKSNDATDDVLLYFYRDITGPYWDPERKFIDEKYRTIPFPFKEIRTPELFIESEWSFDQFIGFLNTWSAVQHYIRKNKENPVEMVYEDFQNSWGDKEKKIFWFPMYLRATMMEKN